VTLHLPLRTGIERILIRGLTDEDLVATLAALDEAIPDVRLPTGYEVRTGRDLERIAIDALHDKSGAVHAAFVRALPVLGPNSILLVRRIHQLATARTEMGIVAL